MNRSLVWDSAVYSIGILLTRALGFLLIPLYTRYLTVADYGVLSLLVLLLQGVNFICLFGINSAAQRLYFLPAADDRARQDVFGTATSLLLVAPAVTLLVLGPVCWWLASAHLTSIPFYPYVLLVLLMGLFTPLISLMSSLLTAQRRPGAYISFHLSYFSVQSVAIILALATLGAGLKGQVFAQFLTCLFFGTISIFVLIRYARPRWSKPVVYRLLAFGAPFLPFFIASWIDTGAGRFAIENYLDLEQVGLFALASQFAGIITLISSSLDQAVLPHFLRRANDPDAPHALGLLIARYLAFFGLMAIGITIVSAPTVVLATTSDYFEAITYIGPVVLANLLYVARTPIMWSLSHSNRTGLLSAINVMSTATLVLLLVLFLGYLQLGLMSVAYAMIVANLLALVAGVTIAQRNFRVQLPWARLGLAGIIIAGGMLMAIHLSTPKLEPIEIAGQFAILALIAVALWKSVANRRFPALPTRS